MVLNVKGDMIKRGEKQVSGKEKKEEEENKINPSDYSCEVILEKTTKDKADDRNFLVMPLMFFMWLRVRSV